MSWDRDFNGDPTPQIRIDQFRMIDPRFPFGAPRRVTWSRDKNYAQELEGLVMIPVEKP